MEGNNENITGNENILKKLAEKYQREGNQAAHAVINAIGEFVKE